jgi:UDP-glucose 4-epimerase
MIKKLRRTKIEPKPVEPPKPKLSVVTGGAGFIGSNLVERLLERGDQVVVIDNESANTHDEVYWNPNAMNVKGDVTDFSLLKNACINADCIYHLAADISIQYSIENPTESYKNNVVGTLNVLEVARVLGIKKVVFSSTAAIYGSTSEPCVETDRPDPLNPYSVSKLAGENLMKMYNDLYGIETVSLRYFNVYGPRQAHKGQYAPVIGIFQKQKFEGKPLTIIGDGNQTRDFIHVADVAHANMMVAEKDIVGVFNVGSGTEYSVNQIASLTNNPHGTTTMPSREGEARRSISDNSKLKNIGWQPRIGLEAWIAKQ